MNEATVKALFEMKAEALLMVTVLLVATPARSQSASPPLAVRSLAASCGACHGTDGHPVDGEAMATLAGRSREPLAAQLRAFRESRDATVMHQIARGYTDAQIDTLAAYFAAQPAQRP